MTNRSRKKKVITVLKGIVTPEEWDEDGNLLTIAIHTFDEGEYMVVENRMGKRLGRHLQEMISIRGCISEDENGRKTITIDNYEINK